MRLIVIGFLLICTVHMNGQYWLSTPAQPEELGHVHWLRNYDDAMLVAKTEGRPIFIQFQEVPGCSTCKNYGNNLLTHPLVVELLETYFVPLAIYNNKRGADADILRKFNEPSWNNPVARIIDPKSQKDIVKRHNGLYDLHSLLNTIQAGILASGKVPPNYLSLLLTEYGAAAPRETHLSMYCFWSGEKKLSELEGVISTQAGYMNGTEVVKVKYDANILDEKDLIRYARKEKCADAIYTNDYREINAAEELKVPSRKTGKFKSDKEPKYYLYQTDYKYIPMTALQALKVNQAISQRQSPNEFLSPRQVLLLDIIKTDSKNRKTVVDTQITKAWSHYITD